MWLLIGMFVASSFLGCRTSGETPHVTARYYQNPEVAQMSVRRVVLLPVENTSLYPHAGLLVADAVSNELNAAGLFEVVNLARELELAGRTSVIAGRYNAQLLVDMAHAYRADAVIVMRVSTYHPYDPQRIGLTLHLIGTHDANVLASVDGVWDSDQPAVAQRAQQLINRVQAATPHSENDISLHSPQCFATFVAHEIASTMAARRPVAMGVAVTRGGQ